MKFGYKFLIVSLLLVFTSCGTFKFVPKNESTTYPRQDMNDKTESKLKIIDAPDCKECLIVPRSGTNKDLRHGYYYDQEKGRCVQFSYSTGAGCVPPPFNTLNECLNCCE